VDKAFAHTGVVKSKTEELTPVASLVNIHLSPRAGLAGWPSVSLKWLDGVSCFISSMVLRCAGTL